MYAPKPMTEVVSAPAAALAGAALQRKLTIYAGAGISAAAPTSLPGAAALAQRLVAQTKSVVSFAGVDEWDLEKVADQIANRPQGEVLLIDALSRSADFLQARFSYSHSVMALLIADGAATVLEANYDDCIERAAFPEHLPVAVTDSDRVDVNAGALLKIHGCATRPSTMLVTTDHLNNAPLYAQAELAARLSAGNVLFIGLGSPADYVRKSLQAFVSKVSAASLTVVDPKMSQWATTKWATVMPDLPQANRITSGADEFFDDLLRYYVNQFLLAIEQKVSALPAQHPQRLGTDAAIAALRARDSVWLMRWLRFVGWRLRVGQSAIVSSRLIQSVLALGALSAGNALFVSTGGWAIYDGIQVLVIASEDAPLGGGMAIEAIARVTEARANDQLPPGGQVVVLCCGHTGSLGADELSVSRGETLADILLRVPSVAVSLPDNVLGVVEADHLIDFYSAGSVVLVHSEQLVDAA